jgi:aspartate carbamoyltransferase catalytic subunit
VLHPFPRLGELAEDLDGSPWDGYHAQTALGPEVRRRTLALLLGG